MKRMSTIILGGIFISPLSFALDCSSLENITIFTNSQVTELQSGAESGFAEHQLILPQTYVDNVTKICIPSNTVVSTFSGSANELKIKSTYGIEDEATEISGEDVADITALSFRYNVNGVRYWKYHDEAETGDVFLYHNPFNRKAELFQAKHDGGYWYFPTNQRSNGDWEFIGIEEQIPVSITFSEHQLEAQRRAVEAEVSPERLEQEIYDSSAYAKFELTNGHAFAGNYGFTINFELEPLSDGSQPVNAEFHEYTIWSRYSYHKGENPNEVNFGDFVQTEAISFTTGVEHHLGANAARAIGDEIQLVAYIHYSNGETKIARSNKITLQPR